MPKRVVTEPARDRGPAIVAPARFGGYPGPVRKTVPGNGLWRWLNTTDHKQIGILYLFTSFGFFLAAGIEAMLIRAELARPGMQFLSPEQYNQLFTTHGFAMLLLFATPAALGLANFIVPIQIGAPDVAFPRLNAFGYWLFLFGGLMLYGSFLTPGGTADFGWTAYPPLSDVQHSPGVGANMVVVGLVISGLGTILTAVNMITTIVTLRAPGMTMFRMPIFCWNMLLTSVLVLFVFPLLAAALLALAADRLLDAHVYDPTTGGPMLWQHLFWFFGHPEVYIPRSTSSRCRSSGSSPRSSRSSRASRSSVTPVWSSPPSRSPCCR
jgi:cytochrome c oxidase subunit 1